MCDSCCAPPQAAFMCILGTQLMLLGLSHKRFCHWGHLHSSSVGISFLLPVNSWVTVGGDSQADPPVPLTLFFSYFTLQIFGNWHWKDGFWALLLKKNAKHLHISNIRLKHTKVMMRCVTAKFTGISVWNQSEKVSALLFDQRVDRVMEGFINWPGLLTAWLMLMSASRATGGLLV